jgi:Tfp pilus assembly PilM family ATPase
MAIKRKLGINFDIEALDIVEIEKHKIIAYSNVPYLETKDKAEVIEVTDEIKLASILQNALRKNEIQTDEVIVTIPSRDVLLRTFLIPYLPKTEIGPAVDFESRKFVPLKLDVLYFDYLLQKTIEKKDRRFKTHFMAIKKEILDKFIYALEKSNLRISAVETAPFSLQRILLYKKMTKLDSNIAIIESSQKEGNICIIEKGFPQLIRDFKFRELTTDIYTGKTDDLSSFLHKEIRLSFDYYRRQSPKEVVNKIFLFSDEKQEQLKDSLYKEFNIPTTIIRANEILGLNEDVRIGILKAYGAAIRNLVSTSTFIDLYQKKKIVELREKVEAEIVEIPISRKSIIRTAIIAVIFILFFYLFVDFSQISMLNLKLKNLKQKRLALKHKLSSLELVELQSLKSDYNERIKILKEVKKIKETGYITPVLNALPSLIPDGVWLTSINFSKRPYAILSLKGRAYLKNETDQMNSINNFFTNIKTSKEFQEKFDSINFDFAKQVTVDSFLVTEFGITCR